MQNPKHTDNDYFRNIPKMSLPEYCQILPIMRKKWPNLKWPKKHIMMLMMHIPVKNSLMQFQ